MKYRVATQHETGAVFEDCGNGEFSCEIKIAATLYVTANTAEEAARKAEEYTKKDGLASIFLTHDDGIEIADGVFISSVVTSYGVWRGDQ